MLHSIWLRVNFRCPLGASVISFVVGTPGSGPYHIFFLALLSKFYKILFSNFLRMVNVLAYLGIYTCLIIRLEKAMAADSSTLTWKIPWMEEPGGLRSMGSLGVGHY